ncbi:hypothetical protein RJ639_019048 [Escallonia herrerae]|uniref:NAB domain-containing protein n=1 Tax=Escallonia herrerae TaxID=1293975 RepID=A0AA88V8T7_9ASTE|nr:hypothetical protein RJ639_019048 [Escallonia herrerae]
MEAKNKLSTQYSWWFDSHNKNNPRRSPWLQSTLAELDDKTKAMLKIVEEDADSFAQRAEMYYKKRPELISMVEDFYRAHRSLAERYDLVKADPGTRHLTPWTSSPVSFNKHLYEKLMCSTEKSYDSCSETYGPEESGESEVDDPEQDEEEEEVQSKREMEEISSGVGNIEMTRLTEEIVRLKQGNNEMTKLREEIGILKEENRIQTEQLMQKDEDKREAIRQLSLAVDMLKEENPGTFAEENGRDPDGAMTILGPGANMSSGFGGLGLEGMMGSEDSDGESPEPLGEGKRGVMSGERVGTGEDKGAFGKIAGAAEISDIGNAGEDKQ